MPGQTQIANRAGADRRALTCRNVTPRRPLSSPPYRWLLFDADGTLFDYDRAEAAALQAAFDQIGLPFRPDYLPAYRRINRACWQELEQGRLKPEVLKIRRFERLFDALGLHPASPPGRFSAIYLDCLAARSDLVADAREVLDALGPHYQFAILTNGLQAVQRPRLARSAIAHCVQQLVISEEIGVAKPAPAFFDTALARIGQPRHDEVLMIGDNWTSDIQGAAQYGLDTCWYNPTRQPRPSDLPITREIHALRELIPWLGRFH